MNLLTLTNPVFLGSIQAEADGAGNHFYLLLSRNKHGAQVFIERQGNDNWELIHDNGSYYMGCFLVGSDRRLYLIGVDYNGDKTTTPIPEYIPRTA